ncbi:hypothetical protein D3C87_2060340 [compost metagenome]
MTLHLPSAVAPAGAIIGGQFFAQSSLHIDLPPESLSNVYRVMPLWSTIMPSFIIAGSAAKASVGSVSAAVTSNAFQD